MSIRAKIIAIFTVILLIAMGIAALLGAGAASRAVESAVRDRAVEVARGLGVRRLFLLTSTVRERASRSGFEDVPREELPASIRDSAQVRSLCPAAERRR